jgi:molybdopterin-guanine dinucleotide biosynthesis protein A
MTELAAAPVTVLLLGGGQGRRAGGPKALKIIIESGQLLWRVQRQAVLHDAVAVVAVLHPDAWRGPQAPGLGEIAVPADPEAEPFDSLQRGLRACDPRMPVAVLPVDCPWPGRDVLATLLHASQVGNFTQLQLLAVRPQLATPQGLRGGHPLLLLPPALPLLLDLNPKIARLDHWLRDLGPRCCNVPVTDAAILANFNGDGFSR